MIEANRARRVLVGARSVAAARRRVFDGAAGLVIGAVTIAGLTLGAAVSAQQPVDPPRTALEQLASRARGSASVVSGTSVIIGGKIVLDGRFWIRTLTYSIPPK